jgi:sulfur carrier protein
MTQSNPINSGTIELRLDNRPHQVQAGTSLAELVAQLGYEPRAIATSVNGSFVPRADRAARTLAAGDAVLLFQPIVGG